MYFICMRFRFKPLQYILLILILPQLSFGSITLSCSQFSDTAESDFERIFENAGQFDNICSVIVKNVDHSRICTPQGHHFDSNFIGCKKQWLNYNYKIFNINLNSPVRQFSQFLHTETIVLLI